MNSSKPTVAWAPVFMPPLSLHSQHTVDLHLLGLSAVITQTCSLRLSSLLHTLLCDFLSVVKSCSSAHTCDSFFRYTHHCCWFKYGLDSVKMPLYCLFVFVFPGYKCTLPSPKLLGLWNLHHVSIRSLTTALWLFLFSMHDHRCSPFIVVASVSLIFHMSIL